MTQFADTFTTASARDISQRERERERERVMNSYPLTIVTVIIYFLHSINAQTSFCNKECPITNMSRGVDMHQVHSHMQEMESLHIPNTSVQTAKLRSWHSHHAWHHYRHIRAMHGFLNIIGWGTLLPIGVIVARYCREVPMKCSEWYTLHTRCQISGVFLGSIGWVFGMLLRNASKHYKLHTHGVLGTIIFTLATIQVLSICFKPEEEHECHKYWKAWHHVLGYALIAMIIANIFRGIDNQSPKYRWKWTYIVILAILASIALALELYKWIKIIVYKSMVLNRSTYASS
ncbi:cytochrome b561 and DOMON domain-containing protein At3g25290-like [Camellia sinensis]|uniref:cytochrome b561 and DOMON domain-containing protein At3g25290-like n=1 Tax=Camellia sinensis TaxID=4442 RepID=UPI0010360963|nr:cytochrome b561 and DOMON domain-containing protein At3g25290-like [Camellia sinensis]